MAIDGSILLPLVQPVIEGAMKGVVPALTKKQGIGVMQFGNNEARIEMCLSVGKPKVNQKEYLHDVVEVEAMKMLIYMAAHGKWVKRIDTGMIVYADVYIDYPQCKFCGKRPQREHYEVKNKLFKGKVKICKGTANQVTMMDKKIILQETAYSITNLINRSLGIS